MTAKIRVLVVDDSAFARKVVRELLTTSSAIEVVGTARDGLDALEKIENLKPDVVTLDLAMPQLDGLGVLAAMASARSTARVVIVSSASDDSEVVVSALLAGALCAVEKPTALATDRLYEIGAPLLAAVASAAIARALPQVEPAPARAVRRAGSADRASLVVIGASTGGPQALTGILGALPADLPAPVVVVVHMPVGYTESFAKRLDSNSALEVVEASEGIELRPGRVVIARSGIHAEVVARDSRLSIHLAALPLDTPHRPAVDVLFRTAALAAGAGVLGVVLTGMGDDGLDGARAIVGAGGRVITQSAPSCVVYGMPRAVTEAGLSEEAVGLEEIPVAILKRT